MSPINGTLHNVVLIPNLINNPNMVNNLLDLIITDFFATGSTN